MEFRAPVATEKFERRLEVRHRLRREIKYVKEIDRLPIPNRAIRDAQEIARQLFENVSCVDPFDTRVQSINLKGFDYCAPRGVQLAGRIYFDGKRNLDKDSDYGKAGAIARAARFRELTDDEKAFLSDSRARVVANKAADRAIRARVVAERELKADAVARYRSDLMRALKLIVSGEKEIEGLKLLPRPAKPGGLKRRPKWNALSQIS